MSIVKIIPCFRENIMKNYPNDITLDYFYNPDTSIISGIVKFFGSVIFK